MGQVSGRHPGNPFEADIFQRIVFSALHWRHGFRKADLHCQSLKQLLACV